jgi:hypothetical protein
MPAVFVHTSTSSKQTKNNKLMGKLHECLRIFEFIYKFKVFFQGATTIFLI